MQTIQSARQKPGLIRPEELVRIKDLFLVARGVVEGFISGHHKSPYKGFSLEFAEHRKYTYGDEIRHIDWKVYGRTSRYYVKLFESETNMRVYICLDTSRSMEFGQPGNTKLRYSACLSAALAYLISRQQDLAGLVTFSDKINNILPPGNSSAHVRKLIGILSSLEGSGPTGTAASLMSVAEKVRRRCLFVIVSDLLDNTDEIVNALGYLRNKKHELIVFHVLDNAELMFPFKGMTTFVNMEEDSQITVDPVALRKDYLEAVEAFKKQLKTRLLKINADYVPVNTLMPFEYILSSYLTARQKTS